MKSNPVTEKDPFRNSILRLLGKPFQNVYLDVSHHTQNCNYSLESIGREKNILDKIGWFTHFISNLLHRICGDCGSIIQLHFVKKDSGNLPDHIDVLCSIRYCHEDPQWI